MPITTLEELVDYAAKAIEGEVQWSEAEIGEGCATVPIIVRGQGWNKNIDKRGAKLILDLQARIDELYTMFPEAYPYGAPLLKVQVEEGSNEFLAFFEPLITGAVDKLSPEQIFDIIKYIIFCGTGLFGLGKYFNYAKSKDASKKEKELAETIIENLSNTQRETLKVLERTVQKIDSTTPPNPTEESRYTQPIRTYADSLADEDTIAIAEVAPISQPKTKHLFRAKRAPRSRKRWVGCDTAFVCYGLDLKQTNPRLALEQGGIPITAMLERLTDEERKSLMNRIDERLDKRKIPFRLNLQVNVYFTEAGILYATVVGVGEPRADIAQYELRAIPQDITVAYDEFTQPEND